MSHHNVRLEVQKPLSGDDYRVFVSKPRSAYFIYILTSERHPNAIHDGVTVLEGEDPVKVFLASKVKLRRKTKLALVPMLLTKIAELEAGL